MKELFIPIHNFEDYAVSELGNVKSLKGIKPRVIKGSKGKLGYYVITLSNQKTIRKAYTHHLVLETFAKKLSENFVTNHKDGIKSNNAITNLEWISRGENITHAFHLGLHPLGDKRPNTKIKDSDIPNIKALRDIGKTYKEIAEEYGCSRHLISYICRGTRRKILRG